MKKTGMLLTALALGLALLAGLTACGTGKPDAADPPVTTAPQGENRPAQTESCSPENASVVYFNADISAEGLVRLYEALGWSPSGKTAVKISTGEPPASNYLRPELIGDLVRLLDGTIVECNTAYGGSRSSSAMHR